MRIDDLGSIEHVLPAVTAAIDVAAIVCTRRGADPPWRHELPDTGLATLTGQAERRPT